MSIGNREHNDIATPSELYKMLDDEFHFDHDPCPLHCSTDSLTKDSRWGACNFVNPPFNNIRGFLDKAVEQLLLHKAASVFLIPARLSTAYWNDYIYAHASEIRFLKHFIAFEGYTKPHVMPVAIVLFGVGGAPDKGTECSAATPAAYRYFRCYRDQFAQHGDTSNN